MTARARGFTIVELMVVVAIIAILVTLAMQMSARTYGANGKNVADQVTMVMQNARARAVSTQHYHRVEIQPTSLTVWEWSELGMKAPGGTCTVGPPVSHCWQFVQSSTIPNGVSVWNVTATIYGQTAGGGNGPSSKVTALDYLLDFRPDGSSIGGTAFVSDDYKTNQFRVAVYNITGGSYARSGW